MNGDGLADIVLGASPNSGLQSSGTSYIIFGPGASLHYQPPMAISTPEHQTVYINQPFNFNFNGSEIFNATANTLTYFAQSNDGSPLPSWVHFDGTDKSHLVFSGTPPSTSKIRSWF